MITKGSVAYMTAYLKYALEFEKYVYVWSSAMNDVNKRMQRIYDERRRLEGIQQNTQQALSTLEERKEKERIRCEEDSKKYRQSSRITLSIAIVGAAIWFAIGCGIAWLFLEACSDFFSISRQFVIPITGFFVMLVGSLGTLFVPICLIVGLLNRSKATQCKEKADKLGKANATKYQRHILENQESEADNDWLVNVVEESVTSKNQQQIFQALNSAKQQLANIYAINVLPAKYRNIGAVATMYEYLATGRCNTIQGHGGIYDTYEVERLAIEQLRQLAQMNETLDRIEENQRYIYRELRQANHTLSGIRSSLSDIQKTNEQIANNTAVSAVANQQTAAAAQWMAWHTWANS